MVIGSTCALVDVMTKRPEGSVMANPMADWIEFWNALTDTFGIPTPFPSSTRPVIVHGATGTFLCNRSVTVATLVVIPACTFPGSLSRVSHPEPPDQR